MAKLFSFFSGCGFLDLGFESNGFNIAFVNEFDEDFMNAYKYSRKHRNVVHQEPECGYYQGDINDFLNDDAKRRKLAYDICEYRRRGEYVGFIGGPPCPDFSVAGKQKGKDGDNGKLSKSYVDLIIRMKPDFFLFENVKGLWKTAKHRAFFEELKALLHQAGYKTTERLTNALEFGAPQDRDRILLFGVKRTLLNRTSYLKDEINDFPWDFRILHNVDAIKGMPWPTTTTFVEDGTLAVPEDIDINLTVENWFELNDVQNHFNSDDYFAPRAGLARMQTVDEGDVSRKSYKRLHRWRYSPTAAYGNNEVHLHPYKSRRLSVAEALAIQTLPADFTLPKDMSLSSKFKTIGNGVPFVLASGIAGTINQYLTTSVRPRVPKGICRQLKDLSNP